MILELFAAEMEGRRMNQAGLTRAAEVPHTTGLRIVHGLMEQGVFVTRGDPADTRQTILGLSAEAAGKLRTYLSIAIATVPYLA